MTQHQHRVRKVMPLTKDRAIRPPKTVPHRMPGALYALEQQRAAIARKRAA